MRNLLVLAVLAAALAGPAAAQAPRTGEWVRATVEGRQTRHTAELLARLMISEGGWDLTVDHAAVAWTITGWLELLGRRRPRYTLDSAIRNYAAGFRPAHRRTPRQEWIMSLRAHGGRPPDVRWTWSSPRGRRVSRSDAWKAALERSRAHLRGELPSPCDGPSVHWGSARHPIDRARAARAVSDGRWAEVECAGAMNAYYRILRRRPRRRPIRNRIGQVVRFVDRRGQEVSSAR